MVIFGDDISDSGVGFAAHGWPASELGYNKGWTNGKFWHDEIAEVIKTFNSEFTVVSNAYYGAGMNQCLRAKKFATFNFTGNTGCALLKQDQKPVGVLQQFEAWSAANTAKVDDLYVIFAGAEDILENPGVETIEWVLRQQIAPLIVKMIRWGAKHIALMDSVFTTTHPALSARANATTILRLAGGFSASLQQVAVLAQSPQAKAVSVTVGFYSAHNFLQHGINDTSNLNYQAFNETGYCVNTQLPQLPNGQPLPTFCNLASCPLEKGNNYFWYDLLHPSTRVHQAMGRDFLVKLFGGYKPTPLPNATTPSVPSGVTHMGHGDDGLSGEQKAGIAVACVLGFLLLLAIVAAVAVGAGGGGGGEFGSV